MSWSDAAYPMSCSHDEQVDVLVGHGGTRPGGGSGNACHVVEPDGVAAQQLFGEPRRVGEVRPLVHPGNGRREHYLAATPRGFGWALPRADPRRRAHPPAVAVLRPMITTPLACEVASVTAVRVARLSGT